MSATSRQLFANNAISTLATSISLSDLTLTVSAGQGSLFPAPVSGEFFYLTLEDFSSREICKCTSRSGDLLTIVRAQEGTTALGFPAGASVQSRITKGTLEAFRDSAEAWVKVDAVMDIPAPSVSTASSVICGESDDSGSPILAVKDGSLWKFLSHPYPVVDSVVLSSVQTSITATGAFSALSVVGGKYILQITSGVLAGYSRVLTASSANVASWAEPLPFPVSSGETFSVYVSVTSRMKDLDDRSNFVTKGQFGLGGTSSVSTTDFNTLSVTGQYYGTSATGAPVAGVLIIVDHVQGSGVGSAYQYASRTNSSVAWFRSQTGGVWNAWREAAMLDSPTFTGIPAAPTATVGTSTTQLATTAFVNAEITSDRPYEDSTANVKMNGVVSVGTASTVARGDHVHPTDTSRAATVSPAFTGTPTTPTAAVGTNTTQVASTEYTVAEIGSRAPTKLGVGASGTWGINITGASASAPRLGAKPIYTLVAATTPESLEPGQTINFVQPGDGWPNYGVVLSAKGPETLGGGAMQMLTPYGESTNGAGDLKVRFGNYDAGGNAWSGWKTLLASDNYWEYTVTKTGTGASGDWGINVTGNAATATRLATARNINGVPFDGTASINIPVGETGRLPLAGGQMTGTIYSSTASIIQGNSGGTLRGYLYADSNGFGVVSSLGNWAARAPMGTNDWLVTGACTATRFDGPLNGNQTSYDARGSNLQPDQLSYGSRKVFHDQSQIGIPFAAAYTYCTVEYSRSYGNAGVGGGNEGAGWSVCTRTVIGSTGMIWTSYGISATTWSAWRSVILNDSGALTSGVTFNGSGGITVLRNQGSLTVTRNAAGRYGVNGVFGLSPNQPVTASCNGNFPTITVGAGAGGCEVGTQATIGGAFVDSSYVCVFVGA